MTTRSGNSGQTVEPVNSLSPFIQPENFPVRIYTLGRVGLVVDGFSVVFSGKTQKRPLSLLYFLIAQGGRNVAVTKLYRALWDAPETATPPRGSLDTTIYRLRRLLRHSNAIRLGTGGVSLDAQICWVDVWTFERRLGESIQSDDPLTMADRIEQALTLYQGEFLADMAADMHLGDSNNAWALAARERLRTRLLRLVQIVADKLAAENQWDRLADIYLQLHERYPLDEMVCRQLLRTYIERQEASQAIALFKRCRQLLVNGLHSLPSPATLALLKRLPGIDLDLI